MRINFNFTSDKHRSTFYAIACCSCKFSMNLPNRCEILNLLTPERGKNGFGGKNIHKILDNQWK